MNLLKYILNLYIILAITLKYFQIKIILNILATLFFVCLNCLNVFTSEMNKSNANKISNANKKKKKKKIF